MAAQVDIGNDTILIIKIPARGATDWAAEFKTNFADNIADHDHTTGRGARIKNAALVTNTMVADGDGVTKVDGTVTAYTSADVAVSTDTIQDAAITTAKIAADAVDGTKIADNSITADHIVDGTIIAADVANNAITTAKILDANVTTAKIADDAITFDKLEKTVVVTQDTTITQNTANTHFILESTTTNNVTLTFDSVEVKGCLFTRGGNIGSLFFPKIKLKGNVDFSSNIIDMLNIGQLDLNEVDLDNYKMTYNKICVEKLLADVDGTDTGITNSGPAGGTFTFNDLKICSLTNSIKFPFGTSQVNKFEFLIDGSGTPTFQDHVMDTDGAIRTTYNVGSNIIIFNGGGVTYKTATGTGSGTITTITDTKPFKIIDRTTKVSLVDTSAVTITSTDDMTKYHGNHSILNITSSCLAPTTLENKTINIASGATLTVGDGDTIKNCTITGEGKILMTATDTRSGLQTTPANTVTMKGCTVNIEEFDIKQDLSNPRCLAAVILEDSFINTNNYRYYVEFGQSNLIDDTGSDTSTTSPSQFTNVTIFAKNIIALPAHDTVSNINRVPGTAVFTNLIVTNNITLTLERVQISDTSGNIPAENDLEAGSKTNAKSITLNTI
tara:strand:+ start:5438 stop:7279 length:1842 start_codon:yes stop_codon:yes gene_type:complete